MLEIKRTTSKDPDFVSLVKLLDKDLAIRDGDEHSFYDQFNKIDQLNHTLVIFSNQKAIGCGAIKELREGTMEVKRMYTLPDFRGKGLATMVLTELEQWALELGYTKCLLETGKKQPEAVKLYEKNGYALIPNYGQYKGIENSLCFQKHLTLE